MLSLEQIKHNMLTLKPYLLDKYSVETLYILGSYVREEQTQKSDLDILVDFKKIPDLLTFFRGYKQKD